MRGSAPFGEHVPRFTVQLIEYNAKLLRIRECLLFRDILIVFREKTYRLKDYVDCFALGAPRHG